jgi:hypothetical protein
MTGPRNNEPVRIADFFKDSRPRGADRGRLCDVANCSHIAFVSVRVSGNRRQLCLTHYEVLSHIFGEDHGKRSA